MSLNKSKIYSFKNNHDNLFLYSGYTGLILEWNNRIQNYLENKEFDEEVNNYLQGKLGESQTAASSFSIKPVVKTLTLFVTNQCNLACSYCHEKAFELHNSKSLDIETLKKTVLYFLENFEHQNVINICFCGDELLLNLPLIKESVNVLKEIGDHQGINFKYSLTTNGTFLNEEIIDFLIRYNISVEISIDGLEILPDLHRRYLDGRGSYQTIIDNVSKLAAYCDVSARVTVTNYQIDLIGMYQKLENAGFCAMKTECVVDHKLENSEEEFRYFVHNLQLFADYFIDNIKQRKIIYYTDFLSVLKNFHFGAFPSFFPCSAGLDKYAVTTDGSIYFCHYFSNIPEFKWGDVNHGFDREKRIQFLKSHLVMVRGKENCDNCWAQRICGGTCYYISYVESETTKSISDNYCRFKKEIFKKALYIYTSLLEEEKVFLDNINLPG